MAWAVTSELRKFDEAIEFFAGKFPLTKALIAELGEHSGPRAWTVAGVSQLEIVQQTHASLLRAIENGTPFAEWQKEAEASLTKAWGKRDSARLRTIFVNATQQANNAGRWAQQTDPEVLSLRPFGMYDSVVDDRTSEFCRTWDGVILPLEEFAKRNACPQTHHLCRASIRSLRPGDAKDRGGTTAKPPTVKASKGFGEAPTTAMWKPDRAKYDPQIWNEYERKAAALEETAKRPLKKTA